MASKSDLSSSSSSSAGVQNVVVYVSNDNFARTYAIDQHQQQNVPQQSNNLSQSEYTNANHTVVATALDQTKNFHEKQQIFAANGQINNGGYFTNVIPAQNGIVNYQGGAIIKNYTSNEVFPCDRHQQQQTASAATISARSENLKSRGDEFAASYVTIFGTKDTTNNGTTTTTTSATTGQSVRCDSVRSETTESSCSSLSSVDEGMIIVQNRSSPTVDEMVVYDPSVSSVRSGGGVVLVGPSPPLSQQQQQQHSQSNAVVSVVSQPTQFITVPYGWKRLVNNGSIIYISPSNTALNSFEQVKEYLLTSGTCKCGLECHFKYDTAFNFDPKVIGKPWVLSPDINTGDLTKLCNHKRKIMAMASMNSKLSSSHDSDAKLRKEFGLKRKRRKIGVPYSSISQIYTHQQCGEKPAPDPQQVFSKDVRTVQQGWSTTDSPADRLNAYPECQQQNQIVRCQELPEHGAKLLGNPPMILNDSNNATVSSRSNFANSNNISKDDISHNGGGGGGGHHLHSHQIISSTGQIINFNISSSQHEQNRMNQIIQGQSINSTEPQHQPSHNRLIGNVEPNVEPTGPGRPQIISGNQPSMKPINEMHPRLHQQQSQQYQHEHVDFVNVSKHPKQFSHVVNGMRSQCMPNQSHNNIIQQQQQQQKLHWQNKMQSNVNYQQPINPISVQTHSIHSNQQNMNDIYERVPPLHHQQHHNSNGNWQEEEILRQRKKVKINKIMKNRRQFHIIDNGQISNGGNRSNACPNIDVRQISSRGNERTVVINQMPQQHNNISSPSFMEDPSGYLAQQTALLNSTINRQTCIGSGGYVCSRVNTSSTHGPQNNNNNNTMITISNSDSAANAVPLPSNVNSMPLKPTEQIVRIDQGGNIIKQQPNSSLPQQHYNQMNEIQMQQQQHNMADSSSVLSNQVVLQQYNQPYCVSETNASTFNHNNQKVKMHNRLDGERRTPISCSSTLEDSVSSSVYSEKYSGQRSPERVNLRNYLSSSGGFITTVASGRTNACNTVTSVVASGRNDHSNVPMNNSSSGSNTSASVSPAQGSPNINNVTKTPLEMVQSVVSSIQVPQQSTTTQHQPQQHPPISLAITQNSPQPPQFVKHSPTSLPPGHILVSPSGQLIMTSGNNNVMAPPAPKMISTKNGMPPISVSPMVTNVTAAVTQVIPAVAQQVIGQQTVLVNALPTAPFVIQPGVTMTMDGMTVHGQNMQIPQIVTGNVIQQQIQLDNSDFRRAPTLLSPPETKKKGKKRKMSSQTVAGMLHIAAAQQSPSVMMPQQSFPQQIQMTTMHSPVQGITASTAPMMQALTIVPNKTGGSPQILMNGQTISNVPHQQIIANSQQINLLQPVNLLNGATGVVQNFPIQQFIVPNIGSSMVMNPDGTATILQDTSNLGMQLQIQNVNGQNILTPVQSNSMFNGGQNILTTTGPPAGMVIRTSPTSQGKISPTTASQFLSPNGGGGQFVTQFNGGGGQLSPLVASLSPSQQVTFNTSSQSIRSNNQIQTANPQHEFIQIANGQHQMGQTLMVPCTTRTGNIAAVSSSNQQNATFVQQNTTIVQQQTTMLANNQQQQQQQHQQLQNIQHNNQQHNISRSSPSSSSAASSPASSAASVNMDQQNFIINSNDNNHILQTVTMMVQQQQQQQQQQASHSTYRQSTPGTIEKQNFQATNTASYSPPDTTTLSPIAGSGCGQQTPPPTVDTTTHTGTSSVEDDDGLSPAPSSSSSVNCSIVSCNEMYVPGTGSGSGTMAMVHCISSSGGEQADDIIIDDAEAIRNLDMEWKRRVTLQTKQNYNNYYTIKAEEYTNLPDDEQKPSMHYASRKHKTNIPQQQQHASATAATAPTTQYVTDIVMEMEDDARQRQLTLFEHHRVDDEETNNKEQEEEEDVHEEELEEDNDNSALMKTNNNEFIVGDLIWALNNNTKSNYSMLWPGKIINIDSNKLASVKWFGGVNDKFVISKINIDSLYNLSEGFEAYHNKARTMKIRTSRKLSSHLEKAIQEAMTELDRMSNDGWQNSINDRTNK